jgi:hypothetical protein
MPQTVWYFTTLHEVKYYQPDNVLLPDWWQKNISRITFYHQSVGKKIPAV